MDADALQAIKAREELGENVQALKARSLNPKDKTPGVRENPHKTWARIKANFNIDILPRLKMGGPST